MGLHEKDTLQLTHLQKQRYHIDKIADIFPKYYLLNVNNFNDMAHDTLDEWVSFFKNSGVKDNFRAVNLDKTKKKITL